MAVSANYPSPVVVNGFLCKNCTDVDYAKKHIDPAHPKDGPFGVDAKTKTDAAAGGRSKAVSFGGQLSGLSDAAQATAQTPSALGGRLDISA